MPGRQPPARLSRIAGHIVPSQALPPGPASRRKQRKRRLQPAGQSSQPRQPGRRPRAIQPVSRPIWQNPTAITTVLAVIATIVLIVVVNSKQAVPNNPSVLNPPPNPVPDSIARQGAVLGQASAPVKMDAWEDYQCPYCGIWTLQWEPHVVQDFVAAGIVRYTFHDYAFLGAGHAPDESLDAAVAAQCASDQGKFWQYHDWLYANQNPNGEDQGWFIAARLDAIALKVGLDQATFDTCRADPAKAIAVQAERTAGTALGITGTPAIFVNDKLQALNTYADLSATIRSLAGLSAAPSGSSGQP